MAINVRYRKKFKNVLLKSGYLYSFKYRGWGEDPKPTIILMGWYEGRHPNTGHEWHFIQGINFFYIPRSHRKNFAKMWTDKFSSLGDRQKVNQLRFTWPMIKRRFPFMDVAVRRYFWKPTYYISDLKEIPFDNWDEAIVGTWAKDYSKKFQAATIGKILKKIRG